MGLHTEKTHLQIESEDGIEIEKKNAHTQKHLIRIYY